MNKKHLEKHKVTIRSPRITDIDALTSMVNSLVKERALTVLQKRITKKEEEQYLKNIFKEIKNGKNITFVIDFDGRAMGTSGISKNDSVISNHIGDIGIVLRKEARGMGLGKQLFRKTLEEGVKKFKFRIVQLDVFSENKIAINLYKNFGFEEIGIIKKGVIHFGKYKDRTIMVKYIK
jgi:RimJ/RimL family protein N-acetyltransferase